MPSLPRLERHEVVRIRGERWRLVSRIDFDGSSLLEVDGCESANRHTRTRFLLPYDRAECLPAADGPRVVRLRRWRHVARLELADAVPGVLSLRAAARAAIATIPFQLEPALAVARGLASRVLLADEVGLGKTIQAGLIVSEVLERTTDGHILILCPASLRDQWRQELSDRFRLTATVLDSAHLADADGGRNPWGTCPVVVASTDYVKRPEVIRALESIIWDATVLDEAHSLAGASERAQAAAAVARRSRLVVLVSATPHSGDQDTFARLCGLGRLPGDPPLLMFRRTRADAGLPSSRRTHWLRVRSSRDEVELHRSLLAYASLVWRQPGCTSGARLAMSVLLKRACSSAGSLQRSVEKRLLLLSQPFESPDVQLTLPFELTSSDDAEPFGLLASPGLSDRWEERRRLEHLLELASQASRRERKLEILRRLLRRTAEPIIVFTEYRDTLDQIDAALTGQATLRLHGGLTMNERHDVLRAFASGPGRVLLATDAASEGLNLHHRCRLVLNMELPWTPVRLEQRIGRVDRIGQRRRVHAIHLIAADTVEEKTAVRLFRRSAEAAATLSSAACSAEPDIARLMLEGHDDSRAESTWDREEIRVVDLRDEANREAQRIVAARTMKLPGPLHHDTSRSAIAAQRRRRPLRVPTRRCYWGFRGDFVDRSGRLLWSTLLGLTADASFGRLRSAREVRALLNPSQRVVIDAIHAAHEAALADLRRDMQPLLSLALRRERELSAEIGRTRARLAFRQPGLFDRRADREASAQSAILDEALVRSSETFTYLTGLRAPACGAHVLVFAIAFE